LKTLMSDNGITQKSILSDNLTDELVFMTKQDVSPVIDEAKRLAEGPISKDFKPVAVIPDVIVEKMMREGSWNDPAAMKKWLNDPQNNCFRIWKGRV
jgi:hypothetical protein